MTFCSATVRNRSAFTIIELVVIIVVVGILASISAPRFLDMSQMDAAGAQRQAMSDLRYAQRLAVASGCPVQVDFTPTQYHLRFRTDCRTGAFTLEIPNPSTRRPPFQIDMPTGVTLSSSVDPLVFDSLGRATTMAGAPSSAQIDVGSRRLNAIGETGLIRVQ